MLDKYIDPPDDVWETPKEDFEWIDDLYDEWSSKEETLHVYECRIFNELDRRTL